MDETQSLLTHTEDRRYSNSDPQLVDFDPDGDPNNPLEWQNGYKQGIVLLLAAMALTVTFTCLGVIPVADQIASELEGKNTKSASVLIVTIWELGEAAGPLLIGPLSEIYGRYPVYNICNLIFILGVVLAALSRTTNLFLFSRFLTGLAVPSNVLGPAIIGDMFPSEKRGAGISLIVLGPLIGGAIGPAISGAIAQSLGWRTVLWISAGASLTFEICFFTFFRETYKVVILKRKASRLRKETNDDSLKCVWDGEDIGIWSVLRASVMRPLMVAWESPVLQIMSFYGGLVFALFYILATTLPEILREAYHFSPFAVGISFMSFSIGAASGTIFCGLFLDRVYVKLGKDFGEAPHPEHRLPFTVGAAIALPAAVILYGWSPYHWPVAPILLSVAMSGFCIILVMIPLSSYVVDAFGVYSASALTMLLIVRCLDSTILPLAVPPLVDAFGVWYGFLIMAAIYLVVVPLPILVMRYGKRWRQSSVYTRDSAR